MPSTTVLFQFLVAASFLLPVSYMLYMHSQLPVHQLPQTPTPKTLLLLACVIERGKIPMWLHTLPDSWFRDVNEHGKLVLVVGGERHVSEWTDPRAELIQLPKVDDNEYPPIGKELHLYEALVEKGLASRYQFFLKFDSDTYVNIPKLVNMIDYNNWTFNQPLYAGSPLHHCDCSPPAPACTSDIGIHYCSGAALLTSAAAVHKLVAQKEKCYDPPASEFVKCGSSDSWLGWCMNNIVGVKCTTARSADPLPPRGKSFGRPDKLGRKIVQRHHICQDLSSHGGVRHRDVLPNTWQFSRFDFLYCTTMHALKLCEDFRYILWNVGNYSWQSPEPPSCGRCLLGIAVQDIKGVPSLIDDPEMRWMDFAAMLGVPAFHINSTNNATAALAELSVKARETKCTYYAIIPGGYYIRLLPLLHQLRTVSFSAMKASVRLWSYEDLTMNHRHVVTSISAVLAQRPDDDCDTRTTFTKAENEEEMRHLFSDDMAGKFCHVE